MKSTEKTGKLFRSKSLSGNVTREEGIVGWLVCGRSKLSYFFQWRELIDKCGIFFLCERNLDEEVKAGKSPRSL